MTRSRANAEEICHIVHRRCVDGGLKPVPRNAVQARINRLDLKLVAQARLGRKSAQNRYAQRPGHFPVERILQSVQIDHSLADGIVVDERYRLSIGRPWLTSADFEHWLTVEVSELYHRDQHRGLGATPLSVWEHGISAGVEQTLPANPRRFRLSFLPIEYRTLQGGGVPLHKIYYWSNVLPTLVMRDESLVVHHDPRESSGSFGRGAKLASKTTQSGWVSNLFSWLRIPRQSDR